VFGRGRLEGEIKCSKKKGEGKEKRKGHTKTSDWGLVRLGEKEGNEREYGKTKASQLNLTERGVKTEVGEREYAG